ncbi:MAG: hypothetical protein R3F11_24735 [Verrucomicrobiales bacterium]
MVWLWSGWKWTMRSIRMNPGWKNWSGADLPEAIAPAGSPPP